MAFCFKPDESVARASKRIARQQIDKALDQLTGQTRATREEAVHDARKRFKKIRALLRLVRTCLGRKRYDRENGCFRDAGRLLAGVRDALVLVSTVNDLTSKLSDPVSPSAARALQKAVLDRQQVVCKEVFEDQDVLASVAIALKAARRRVRKWTVDADGRSALRAGLKQVYKQGYEAFSAAISEPSMENFHEWRKRVKDLWHQLQLVQPLWPESTGELVNQAHTLAGYLGNDHDLAVLRQVLSQEPQRFGGHKVVDTFLPLIARRRAELQQAAQRLGRSVYRDQPKVFVDRLRR